MTILLNAVLMLATIAYPLGYLLGEQQQLVQLPYVLAILWALKAFHQQASKRYFSCLMAIMLTLVGWYKQTDAMYWYPVLMNALMLSLFGGSLFTKQSFVERLARLQEPQLSNRAVFYTRRVTEVWCGVFIFNIIVSTGLILFGRYDDWAWYTGVWSYLLMVSVMSVEWLVRRQVQQRK